MKKPICLFLTILLCLSLWVTPVLASNEYQTWLQSDPRWGSITFGTSDTISKSGCAITSVAKLMVHSGSVSSDPTVFNPGIFCTWLKNNGGLTSQGWLVWSAISNYTPNFSYYGAATLSGTTAQKTATIASYSNDGYVIVAMVKDGGHYVAVNKVENNTVYIMDPANTGYTKLFQYDAAGVTKIQIFKGLTNGSGGVTTYDTSVQAVGVGTYTITSDDGVNLRSGPGTENGILTAIPYNTKVTVTKVSNNWGYTTYGGQKGWFTLEYAKLTNTLRGLQITPPTKRTYLVGEKPDSTGLAVTALYADGTSKKLTSGFSMKEFTTEKPGTYTVYIVYQTKAASFEITVKKAPVVYTPGWYIITSDDGVNLRADATTDSQKLTAIAYDVRVEVTEVKDNWGKVTYENQTGWICLDYAQITEAAVKQTGIEVVPRSHCILTGTSLSGDFFTVKQVYSDGSFAVTDEYQFVLGNMTDDQLPITFTQGDFTQTVTLQVFDTIPNGDCNFDGKVNAGDALGMLKHAVGKPAEIFYKEVADVTGDGKIDAGDALNVLKFAVGKLETL